ncbi:hypothetical protein GCK32_013651 [Trichostrongylus colubriformis]|uniref:Ion transport domain-containing protein n=1 Tax=Trichostrongylus colubriformis TaxID=6319 RepID=A0AAN8IBN1_TRICO
MQDSLFQVIKRWKRVKHSQQESKESNKDDDNVRLVFEPASHTSQATTKENWGRRIFYWSLDETSLIFYLWTATVFIGCFYNLLTIVAMVFEEVQGRFYDTWLILNKVFDVVFLLDLLVLTRRGACMLPFDKRS